MKKRNVIFLFCFVMMLLPLLSSGQQPSLTAKEIIDKSNQLMRGSSAYAEITMTIIRPKWQRTLSMKSWSKGNDYSLIYITAPANEKGQVFLKRQKEMWNWVPSIERMIKIPPSMMVQSWMGSDFTNDDLVKEASILDDYTHHLLGSEMQGGYECYKIELIPEENAPVVWGKIISWISKAGFMPLRNEYYDEDGFLVNIETLSDIKTIGNRTLPTRYELVPAEKQGNKTVMQFAQLRFNQPMGDSFFSIQNMKQVR
jgi:outer membrane lipoprotein-sorting protein